MIRATLRFAALAASTALGSSGAAVSSGASGIAREQSVVQDAQISLAQAVQEQPAAAPGSTVPGPRTSLAQAVGAAEQRTGGRATRAEMERERGSYLYEIKTVSKDKSSKVLVDPASGNIVRVDEPGLIAFVTSAFDRADQRKEQAMLAALEASTMTLAGAIAAAEKETGARAIKAASVDRYGTILFAVQLMKDAAMVRVHVDSVAGKVVTSPPQGSRQDDD